jgi:hypothetical protein
MLHKRDTSESYVHDVPEILKPDISCAVGNWLIGLWGVKNDFIEIGRRPDSLKNDKGQTLKAFIEGQKMGTRRIYTCCEDGKQIDNC